MEKLPDSIVSWHGTPAAARSFIYMVKVKMPKPSRSHSGLKEPSEGEPKGGRVKKTKKRNKKR